MALMAVVNAYIVGSWLMLTKPVDIYRLPCHTLNIQHRLQYSTVITGGTFCIIVNQAK